MIGVDTNVLVHSHRRDSPFHETAARRIRALAEGQAPWAIAWPSIHEFIGIVTHARIFRPPSTITQAIEQVECWLESPSLQVIGEGPGYWDLLKGMLIAGRAVGPLVHDARVAAICRLHGVRTLWSADRDFSRFPEVEVVNPLLAAE